MIGVSNGQSAIQQCGPRCEILQHQLPGFALDRLAEILMHPALYQRKTFALIDGAGGR